MMIPSTHSFLRGFRLCVGVTSCLFVGTVGALAQTYDYANVYTFSGTDGLGPEAALIQGTDGNFYGTTAGEYGETRGDAEPSINGTVFQLTPGGVLTTLHVFAGSDGAHPMAPLVQMPDGTLYGTTGGYGGPVTIFSLATDGSNFTEIVQGSATEGITNAYLTLGADGNLYGTDRQGGSNGYGAIFQLVPGGAVTILYSFQGGSDGEFPNGPLIQATDGNFYGATGAGGGSGDQGTIFRISPAGAYAQIFSFAADGSQGTGPNGLVQASDGNLYGTCNQGGNVNDLPVGTVFRIGLDGTFTKLVDIAETTLPVDVVSSLTIGPDGALYGTGKEGGGSNTGAGGVFRIGLDGSYSTLFSFNATDGAYPFGSLLLASDGSFYGTTAGVIAETDYGENGDQDGTVFKLTLSASGHPSFFTGEVALGGGAYYLAFPSGNYFGYYSYLTDPNYIYHYDLGYEYVFDADDGNNGVYLYDFASQSFFYTSPIFPFPYLYDFSLDTVLYYYPDPNNAGHYNTNGVRYFYDFASGDIFSM